VEKVDLILHPARFQILIALGERPMTTRELAENLPQLPASSIYRHIRALLEGGMVEVSETRLVKGTPEKVYRVAQPVHLSGQDMAAYSPEEHVRAFAMYLASLLQSYQGYIDLHPKMDLEGDRVGYSELTFHASQEEMDEMIRSLTEALRKVAELPAAENRVRRKLSIITFPDERRG